MLIFMYVRVGTYNPGIDFLSIWPHIEVGLNEMNCSHAACGYFWPNFWPNWQIRQISDSNFAIVLTINKAGKTLQVIIMFTEKTIALSFYRSQNCLCQYKFFGSDQNLNCTWCRSKTFWASSKTEFIEWKTSFGLAKNVWDQHNM